MKVLNFDYFLTESEFRTFKEVKEYIEDLEKGLCTAPLYRHNLNNGLTQVYNPKTTFWDVVQDD